MDLFQEVYLDGTGVYSRTHNSVDKARKEGISLPLRLRGWNLILGQDQLWGLSVAVWGRGKGPSHQGGG